MLWNALLGVAFALEEPSPPGTPVDLGHQVKAAAEQLCSVVQVPVSEDQQAALLCWAVDVRAGISGPEDRLEDSGVVRCLNRGEYQLAGAELIKWCFRGNHVDKAALERRRTEQRHFFAALHRSGA